MNDRGTGIYGKDPRVDRAVTWVLTALETVALGVGAWFFRELNQTVSDLAKSVGDLKTEIAVARVERLTAYKEFERRITALESKRP